VLELDSVLLACTPAGFCHQRDRVGGAGSIGVLDEVRVARRDLGAADPVPLQPAGLEQPPGAQLVVRVLEDAAEGPLVRGLGGFPLRLQLGDLGLDLFGVAGLEAELDSGDDLVAAEFRVAIREAELGRGQPTSSVLVHHQGSDQNLGPIAAIGACVHSDSASGRAGNRTGELETAERGRSRPV